MGLGDLLAEADHARDYLKSESDARALFARNPYNTEFHDRTAFFDVDDTHSHPKRCTRAQFLGRNGSLQHPAAMTRTRSFRPLCGPLSIPVLRSR